MGILWCDYWNDFFVFWCNHLDKKIFVCEMLSEMWDLGGLTLYIVVWLQRKWWKKKIEILGCYGFSLIWFLKGN